MIDRLAEYAAGALTGAERQAVTAHLAGCAPCRAELAQWRAVRGADDDPPDGRRLVRQALLRSALDAPPPAVGRPGWALVRAEARLLRPAVLVASALVMALGVVLAAVQDAGEILALVAPLVAAAGISGVHGPRRDPAFEVVAATPTPLRLIVLVRIALIFAYDLVLAVAASAVVTAAGTAGLRGLVLAWLGPMALLSALCLLLVVRFGPDVAIGAALTAWALRLLADGTGPSGVTAGVADAVRAAWSTSAATWTATAVLVALAVFVAGRGEPMGRSGATHLT